MNNSHTLRIPASLSRTATIKLIKTTLDEHSGVILIDLLDAAFPLHRDFFLVLIRKFPKDRYILRVRDQKIAALTQGLGIQTEIAGVKAEFDRFQEGANLATHNMSMLEYLWYEIKRTFLYIGFFLFKRKKKEKKIPYFKKTNSNFILIVFGLIISITLLLFIFHFAVSKTFVYIVPDIEVAPVKINIIYKDINATGSLLSKNTHKMKHFSIPIETKKTFQVNAIDPNSSMRSRGTITIKNSMLSPIDLRPTTRFVTADGLVFRLVNWAKIPPMQTINGIQSMGEIDAEVIADPQDTAGAIIGKRGNVPRETAFTVPGLVHNKEKIFAHAKIDFVGGDEPSVHILTEEELKKFEKNIREQLEAMGQEAVKTKVQADLQTLGEDFTLLIIPEAISFSDVAITIDSGHIVGSTAEEVTIKATGKVTALAFDRKATIDTLTNLFHERLLQGTQKAIATYPETLKISNTSGIENVLTNKGNEVKLTVEMNASTAYDFENRSSEITRRLKTIIAGLSKKEAIDRISNEGFIKVKEVSITSSPFWIGNVASNPDNIEFILK